MAAIQVHIGAMSNSDFLLPPEYNLARASEERAKAEACVSPMEKRGYLEMAAIFEQRAQAWQVDPQGVVSG